MEQILIEILLLLPELIFLFGLYKLLSRIHFLHNSKRVFGEVTGIEARQDDSRPRFIFGSSHRRAVYHPKIYYQDESGKRYRLIVGQVARLLSYNTGENVAVIYSLSKPNKAFLNNLYCIWVVPFCYCLVGVGLLMYKYVFSNHVG